MVLKEKGHSGELECGLGVGISTLEQLVPPLGHEGWKRFRSFIGLASPTVFNRGSMETPGAFSWSIPNLMTLRQTKFGSLTNG